MTKKRCVYMLILLIVFVFSFCNIKPVTREPINAKNNVTAKATQPENKSQEIYQLEEIEWTIDVVDLKTRKPINNAHVGITALNQKYSVTLSKNILKIPRLLYPMPGKYPYGYTIITMADGYLPTINHSIPSSTGQLLIEMKKLEQNNNNGICSEFFYGSSINVIADVPMYYEPLKSEVQSHPDEINPSEEFKWKINVIELDSNKPIKNAYIGILDLNKKYQITSDKNTLILPKKPTPEVGKYPYGYTTVTMAKGYLPSIDHNLPDSTGEITIKLRKIEPGIGNIMFDEEFHKISKVNSSKLKDVIELYQSLKVEGAE